MKQTDPQFKLRIPPELKAQIDTASKENRRSINAEIVARLEESFGPPILKGNGPFIVEGQKQSYAMSNFSQLLRAAALHYEHHAQLLERSAKVKAEIAATEYKILQLSKTIHDSSQPEQAAEAVHQRADVLHKQDQLQIELANLNQELAVVEATLRGEAAES